MTNFKNEIATLKAKKEVKKEWLDFFKPTKKEVQILDKVHGKKPLDKRETLLAKNIMTDIKLAKLDCEDFNNNLKEKNSKIEGQIEALRIQQKMSKALENFYKELKEFVPADKVASISMNIDGGGYKCKEIKKVKLIDKKEALKKCKAKAEKQQQKDGSKGKTTERRTQTIVVKTPEQHAHATRVKRNGKLITSK